MISTGSLHSSSGTLLAGSSANSISEVTDIETEEECVVIIAICLTHLIQLLHSVHVEAILTELVQENEALNIQSDPTGWITNRSEPTNAREDQ